MHIDLAQGGDAYLLCMNVMNLKPRRRVRRRENPTVLGKISWYHHAAQTNNTRRFLKLERCSRRGVTLAG